VVPSACRAVAFVTRRSLSEAGSEGGVLCSRMPFAPSTPENFPPRHVIDQQTFEHLLPFAYQWAKAQEEFILARGAPLAPERIADARRVGVRDCSRVKVLVVDRIPMPDNKELAAAARRTHIITDASRGVAIGHGIIIRADCWGDRELLLHNLVHVAQCERSGGLEPYVQQYLCDRHTCAKFTVGSFEDEARRIAREICAADAVVK
jgi:hypothetical protein